MKIKRIFFPILLLLIFSEILIGQIKKSFDVKTKLSEKTDLMPAKAGTIIFLLASDWAGIREVGEDYSLWLKNYKRKKENGTITVEFDIEVRTASMIRSGSLLTKEKLKVSFKAEDNWQGVKSITDAVEREMKNKSKEIKKEALFIGEEVEKVLKRMMRRITY
jgi:hypothetical protein